MKGKRWLAYAMAVGALCCLLWSACEKEPLLEVSSTTPTPTPTATPLCPVSIDSDTTWGPGAVRVGCNVGVTTGVTLTMAAGTEVQFTGDWKMDVQGRLYAVGTVTEPITITHETLTTTHSYGWIYLRGDGSTLDYVNIYYGSGLNLADESTISHCTVMTNTYGLAFMGPWAAEVTSCTVQYNGYGLYLYSGAQPAVQHCNVLSNTVYDVAMHQPEALSTSGCWWGSDPPDEANVWDTDDDLTLGDVLWSDYASSWVSW
jgi:parallel beta-helix repeat protein